jgi:hypothetical protein
VIPDIYIQVTLKRKMSYQCGDWRWQERNAGVFRILLLSQENIYGKKYPELS